MTPERLAEIRKTLKAVKRGEYLHHYQSYILDVTDCIAHIEAQDGKIAELEVAKLKNITLDSIDAERIQSAVTEYEDVWVAYQNAWNRDKACVRELEQLVSDVKLGRERVIAERDAMRDCVEVLRKAHKVLDHCLEDDDTEPDWSVLKDIEQVLAKLDEAQKGGE